jgi:hypothetical protein
MAVVTGLTGRKYQVSDAAAQVFGEAAARLAKFNGKVSQLEGIGNGDLDLLVNGESGLIEEDDVELSLGLLKDFWAKKAAMEEETLEHILSTAEDVTGKA